MLVIHSKQFVMKNIILILLLFIANITFSQDNSIGIGLIADNQTKLSKSFAFSELFEKNPILLDSKIISNEIVDYVYTSYFGIEGTVFENNVNLKFYKEGKKIKDIKCNNDWETIYNSILTEIQKFGEYKSNGKFKNISEGKQADFYSRKILDNLPGKLTIQVPENKIINLKSINANIVKFKSKNPSQEIKELFGKFSTTDLKDINVFKAPQVPESFKSSVKPLLFPISKTMTFSLKMLSYGGVFIEKKENNLALNCLYTALNNSKETISSTKEKATIKSFAFKNISDIYSVTENKNEMSKLFALASDLNMDFSNSDVAQKEYDEYYTSISKVETLCENVENQLIMANNALTMKILSSVSSSLSASSSSFSDLGVDISSLTSSLSQTGSQGDAMQQSSTAFFNELSQTSNLVKAESFIIDGVDLKNDNNYVSNELLYYLMTNPLIIKPTLLEFSKDKPKLNKLLLNFYNSKETNKSKLIQDIYVHFNKIEVITIGLESRNKVVEEKYKSNF